MLEEQFSPELGDESTQTAYPTTPETTPDTLRNETDDHTERAVIAVLEANMLPEVRKGKVSGWENFEASRHLPEELKNSKEADRLLTPVIATTHHTDNDIPMTYLYFSRRIKAGVGSLASNQLGKYYGRLMNSRLGRNIFNVSNRREGSQNRGELNVEDYVQMAKAMKDGRAVILSSYSPGYEGYGDRELPDRPGLGVVLAANMGDRVVLPTVINWHGKGNFAIASDLKGWAKSYIQNRGRPRADMNIARPIYLDRERDIPSELRTTEPEVQRALLMLDPELRKLPSRNEFPDEETYQKARALKIEERDEAMRIWDKLRKQAEIVMRAQAAASQPESRGGWRDRLDEIFTDAESVEHVQPDLGGVSEPLLN